VAELVELLRQDEAACDEYLVRTGIHAHLAVIVPGLVEKPYQGPDALGADSGEIPRRKFRSARWGSRAFAAGFAGVMMVGGLWVLALAGRSLPSVERHVPPPSVVARFGAFDSAKWVAADARHEGGDPIWPGQYVDGSTNGSRLRQGELMTIEPGRRQVTVRIERGEGSPDFRFATIAPPSAEDYADASRGLASVSLIGGPLAVAKIDSADSSGGVDRLVDGRAQGSADAALESVFLLKGARGGFCFDLGRPVAISKINSYSWYDSLVLSENRVRAKQKYTVWGFAGDDPPDPERPSAENGFERIARIDTDNFFNVATPHDRPAQQACSITSGSRSLGRYRYIIFEVHPTVAPHDNDLDHTFYGEIDVYAEP
jgi:hypothetical protein